MTAVLAQEKMTKACLMRANTGRYMFVGCETYAGYGFDEINSSSDLKKEYILRVGLIYDRLLQFHKTKFSPRNFGDELLSRFWAGSIYWHIAGIVNTTPDRS